ncbi:Thiamine-phosphate synthase [Psychrobacter sp. SC65A.3]|uniref:thiamine phosphate synthase n=1 Tax=unclassified Psychrobacter TaxID=196806 RepID=UPI0015E60D39|nr:MULTISPECIES: thiamine phosphate synthase [unclassified Psychrobacter]MBA2058376.1 thiamine phosphate synthase [Psychrobacter sp. D2]WAI88398.1 Thiamine-phosphate synthase [Psychrobacter sp. SC65A.3]
MIQPSVSTVSHTIPKLYLLTNDDEFSLLYQKLEAALATGLIALLQIRRKQILALPDGESLLYEEALQIVNLAKTYNVPVLINDNIALAEKLGIGVHLGQQDGDLSEAAQSLAPNQIIGRTCHGDITLVKAAKNEGASYAAMGAIFVSTTKPNAATISRQQLIEGCQQDIKICVIGGLTAENISELAGLPIAYIAIVGDIMDLPVHQIAMRCQQWQQVFNKWNVPSE